MRNTKKNDESSTLVEDQMASKYSHSYNNSDAGTTKLIQILSEDVYLFHNTDGTPFARYNANGRVFTSPLQADAFGRYLQEVIFRLTKISPTKYIKEQILDALIAKAVYEGDAHEVHLRSAWNGNALYYDLGRSGSVKVTADGWSIEKDSDMYFRSFQHQSDQCVPVMGGSLDELFSFLNISDDNTKTLLKAYLVTVLIPDIPRPMLSIHGAQGSAKSTTLRMIKSLIDPSKADLMSFPKKMEELIQQLSHQFLVCYDNLSRISEEQSDTLARAVTGNSFTKRKLFTDDEDFVYRFKRAVAINGINVVATKPDLLDRALIVELKRVSETRRVSENDLWSRFEEAKPRILGAIFTVLSKAMATNLSEIETEETYIPRLADNYEWSKRVMVALGMEADDYARAYRKNMKMQNDEAVESNALAQVVIAMMDNVNEIKMEPSDLFVTVKQKAMSMALDTGYGIPRDSNWLWKRLKEIEVTLNNVGIVIERLNERPRYIVISSV